MIAELIINPQEQFNLFDIEYKHGGRPRTMMQKRTELIKFIMLKEQCTLTRADEDFEKIMSVKESRKEFFTKFLEDFH